MKKILKPFFGDHSITQTYGAVGQTNYYNKHYGIDYGCPSDTPIVACDNGVVVFAGYATGYGYMVKIRHDWGFSIYGHLLELKTEIGNKIECGDLIGFSGSTGWSTGPHLHFECRDQSDRVFDQTQYITNNINEVVKMKLSIEQVRKWYLAILRREPETDCPYIGAEMSEQSLAYELAESEEHRKMFDQSQLWQTNNTAGLPDNVEYKLVDFPVYKKVK